MEGPEAWADLPMEGPEAWADLPMEGPEAWVVQEEPWGHRLKLGAWKDYREAKVVWEHPPVERVVP